MIVIGVTELLVIVGVISFVLTYVMVPVSMKIAEKVGAIDMPSERRIHVRPMTRMGGIALFTGIVASSAIAVACIGLHVLPEDVQLPEGINFIGLLCGFVFMFAVGIVDDIKQISAKLKLLGQTIAAIIVVCSGVLLADIHSGAASVYISFGIWAYPITVFYLVAFANIINLIDGLDGLAAGVSAICATAFLVLSCQLSLWATASMAIAIVASCVAFLRFNLNPAKLFMGDSGSLILGFGLGIVSLMGTMRVASITSLAVPVVIAAIPALDTLAAIVRRKRNHVSIGAPDKGHIHHRLLQLGMSQRKVVFTIYGICALFAASGVIIAGSPFAVRIAVVIIDLVIAAVIVWKLGLFGKVLGRYYPDGMPRNFGRPKGDEAGEDSEHPRPSRPQKILFVSQHYWPEPFNTTDICEELVKRGHEVTVLTGQPNYPKGNIYPGYENHAIKEEERNGVRIVRVKLHPRKTGPIHRVWNYYSFSWNGMRAVQDLDPDFDIVYSYQTSPVMMANPALEYGRKYGAPVLLHCVDIWPECLTAGGIKVGSSIYNYFLGVSNTIYSSADELAVSSEMFAEYLRQTVGVENSDILFLPQYAEDIFDEEPEMQAELNEEDFPQDKINIMFAGNVGATQSVKTAIQAAARLKDEGFIFHIVGSGTELEACEELAKVLEATNVRFHGRHTIEEMPAYYARADAMLATFANSPTLGYTLPRKIQSYMAAGKPIIGTIIGASRKVIDEAQCGLCCDAEDPVGLVKVCRDFAALSRDEWALMGERGKEYYEEHFSKNAHFSALEKKFREMKGTKHGRYAGI